MEIFLISKIHKIMICTILGCVLLLFIGCPSGLKVDTQNSDSQAEYDTILPQFARFPVINPSLYIDQTTSVTIEWEEPYPAIQEYNEVIAVFSHSIEGWSVSDSRFRLNTEYNLLEWQDIRQRGVHSIELFDAQGGFQYRINLISMPSKFLDDAFRAAIGVQTTTTLDQWWVDMRTPEHFYVSGNDADGNAAAHQIVFVSVAGGSVNERAMLKSKTIEVAANVDELYTIPALDRMRVLNVNFILEDLKERAAELCAPPEGTATYKYTHEYVVTRSRVVERRLRALTGSQHFLLLSKKYQRDCFASAYLFEILPSKPPATTTAHQDSLPGGMRYPRDTYDLVWNEDYDDTLQDLYNKNYFIHVAGSEPKDTVKSFRYYYPFENNPYTYDDPIMVKDGKLFIGYGLRSEYDSVNGRDKYECDPERLDNPIESLNPDKCNVRIWLNNITLPYYFKYGYLEIEYARTPVYGNSMFVWMHSTMGTLYNSRENKKLKSLYVERGSSADVIPLREIYLSNNHEGGIKWEMKFYGSELQLMEKFLRYPDPIIWIVNHYGYLYPTDGNARFYYDVAKHTIPLGNKFTYAIEWAPDGYIIWLKRPPQDWSKYSEANFTAIGTAVINKSNQCQDSTAGKPAEIGTVSGIIQCGINHVPMALSFGGAGNPHFPPGRQNNVTQLEQYFADPDVSLRDRFAEIEHIRLYKPSNNYADIAPVYQ